MSNRVVQYNPLLFPLQGVLTAAALPAAPVGVHLDYLHREGRLVGTVVTVGMVVPLVTVVTVGTLVSLVTVVTVGTVVTLVTVVSSSIAKLQISNPPLD